MEITMGEHTYKVYYVDDLDTLRTRWGRLSQLPTSIKYDTETDGLHLKKSMPFMGAIAFRTPDGFRESWVFPTTKNNLALLPWFSRQVDWTYCHNTIYDMHVTANKLGDALIYAIKNWADTMGLLRCTFEAVSPRDGGESLALKKVSKKYVVPDADRYEKDVKAWIKAKKAADRKILIAMLKEHKWTMKRFEAAMNQGTEPIPDDVWGTFQQWRVDFPEPNYKDVPMNVMIPYVASDVILTDILEEMCVPVVLEKNQWSVVEREFKNLRSTFKMTRRGFRIDRPYLFDCKTALDMYIEEMQIKMYELAGREFSVGQDVVIKDIYEEKLGYRPESTDKKFLKGQVKQGDELAAIIRKLRSLEKWRSTYVDHMLESSEYDGRLYAGLNQFGTVSGRHSGDFQQMPKEPLLTLEGDTQKKRNGDAWTPGRNGCNPDEELFHPRKAVIVDEDSKLFYLDFSQEELRFQANFTLYLGGDLNLCRAYMPYKCVHYATGELYDYNTFEGRTRWSEMDNAPEGMYWEDALSAGHSAWVVPETGERWVPTDVHGSTAKEAMRQMGLDPDTVAKEVFKYWRSIGKTYNFMKTYGGGPKKSAEVLDITVEECTMIDNGFTSSFPVIIDYQNSIVRTVRRQGYITNMYGRRYYISDPSKAYKLANYNIQGSCADDLKEKILIIDDFLEKNGCRSQILMPIHDELAFEIYDDERWVVPELCKIMMNSPKLLVPLVVEPDWTETNWAAKKAYTV